MKNRNAKTLAYLLILGIAIVLIQKPSSSAEKSVYVCSFTSESITIDGLLNELAWQKAKTLRFFVPVSGKNPESPTEAQVLWDNQFLYVGFKAYDKDIGSRLTQRDSPTYKEDVLEVFIQPNIHSEPYYNFEINALGTIYDAYNMRDVPFSQRAKWNCEELKVKIKIMGTLNNPADEDSYWQMEVAIPFKNLPVLGGKSPRPGDRWLFHLARYDYSAYLPEGKELSSCARLSKVNFHNSKDWLILRFSR